MFSQLICVERLQEVGFMDKDSTALWESAPGASFQASTPVTWDDVEEATAEEGAFQWRLVDRDPTKCRIVQRGPHATAIGVNHFEVGSVPRTSERLMKTPFYGCFPSSMEPACISANDNRILPELKEKLLETTTGEKSIIATQIEQYAEDFPIEFDQELADKVMDDIFFDLKEHLINLGLPINAPADIDMALAEAINGKIKLWAMNDLTLPLELVAFGQLPDATRKDRS